MVRTVAGVVVLGVLLASAGTGQEPAGEIAEKPSAFVLGTKVAPPFAMKDDQGQWSGITIDLVRLLAADLGRPLEIRESDLGGLFAGLEDGRFDLAASALTITAERETRVDFSQPYFSSGLGIATSETPRGWWGVVRGLVSLQFLRVVGGLVALLFAVGFLVWLFERRRNAEQFGGSAVQGLGSGLWWSAVTMTTVGYGDKAPATAGGRIVALFWMFASLIAISTFTAAIASSLTVSSLVATVQGPDDLPRARVGAIPGTTGTAYLEAHGIGSKAFDSPEDAVRALQDEEIEAVVYDAPILSYLASELDADRVEVLPERLDSQSYGIALHEGSDLLEPLNRALLRRIEGEDWPRLVASYLGD